MITKSELRLTAFDKLKQEIDREMSVVLDRVEAIKGKLRSNLHSENNGDGLLRQSEEDYFKCLQIGYLQLEQLFRSD